MTIRSRRSDCPLEVSWQDEINDASPDDVMIDTQPGNRPPGHKLPRPNRSTSLCVRVTRSFLVFVACVLLSPLAVVLLCCWCCCWRCCCVPMMSSEEEDIGGDHPFTGRDFKLVFEDSFTTRTKEWLIEQVWPSEDGGGAFKMNPSGYFVIGGGEDDYKPWLGAYQLWSYDESSGILWWQFRVALCDCFLLKWYSRKSRLMALCGSYELWSFENHWELGIISGQMVACAALNQIEETDSTDDDQACDDLRCILHTC